MNLNNLETKVSSDEEFELKVTEFELQLWRVFYGFLRWQEECEKNINNTFLSGNELAILHIVRLKNKSKTLVDIERLLNRDDTHNIRYSLKKLLQLELVKKTLSSAHGKNHLFEITEKGIQDIENFLKLRKIILVKMFKDASLDLEQLTRYLTKIKALYDEADRMVSQEFVYMHDSQTLKTESAELHFGRILVVEDHPTTAKITYKILTDLNYQVDIASSGDMAFNLLSQKIYDVILMDIGLPDMDGCEITRKIRENTESKNSLIPIVGLTVNVSEKEKQNCIDSGMNTVLIKPLIKAKITDIFSKYDIKNKSNFKVSQEEDSRKNILLEVTGDVLDLKLGKNLVGGNEALAKEAIVLLIDSFTEELPKLEKACKELNFINAKAILHKLRGGVSYCGVPRLNQICAQFDDYLSLGKTDLILDFFAFLSKEFIGLKKAVKNSQEELFS